MIAILDQSTLTSSSDEIGYIALNEHETYDQLTYEKFMERVLERVKAIKQGNSLQMSTMLGAQASTEQMEKIISYLKLGKEEGAEVLIGGGEASMDDGLENGYYIQPTIFKGNNKMRVFQEEIFGPVLSLVTAKEFEEALNLINDHQFGNGTSIYTSDGELSRHFTTNCKIGMVGVNVPIPVPMAFHSFGGWKQSLFGDHAVHGIEGVRFYTKLKTVTSRWPKSIQSGPEFVLPTN